MPDYSNKTSSTINIKNVVPLVLDLDRVNYDLWIELFETHCIGFGVDDHLELPFMKPISSDPKDKEVTVDQKEWNKIDSIVKSWIYNTLSQSLLQMILKKKSMTYVIWCDLEDLFCTNKENKAMQLENQLRNIVMGDLSVNDYYTKIKAIADMLDNLVAPIPKRNLVSYTLNGLTQKFKPITTTIQYSKPFSTSMEAWSTLVMEEQQLELDHSRQIIPAYSDNSSLPTIILTEDHQQPRNNRFFHNNRCGRGGRGGHDGLGDNLMLSYPLLRSFGICDLDIPTVMFSRT